MPELETQPSFAASTSSFLDSLRRGWRVQWRCLHALMIREMMVRYGRENVGFLWVILEPMILTAGVLALWSVLKSGYEHGVHIISLVLTGYMPLTLWRHIGQSGIYAFRRSSGILYHRHVSLLDAMYCRIVLEFAGTTCALVVVYIVLYLAGVVAPVVDPTLVVAGWMGMACLAAGLAVMFAVLTEWSETAERFIAPFQYLMLPISGVFFMVDWLPSVAQQVIWYNPPVHTYEMFRAGFFGDSVQTHYTWWYPYLWGLGLTAAGLWGIEKVRDRIHF